MFTGIIEALGTVARIDDQAGARRITYATPLSSELEVDDSVAINGVCQTVVARDASSFQTIVIEESLRKTNFGVLRVGEGVNLERSLRMGDRLDGHLVQGHTDCTGRIESVTQEDTNWLIEVSFPDEWAPYIVGRGSIALEGISLTVARLERTRFTVAIIPYTWEHTNLHARRAGDAVNLEFDILGKYILRRDELQS
jgi:riboflavin synthase